MNIKTILHTDDQWASLALRLPAGIILAAHGAQKLFAWFGGYGLEGTGQFMASQGLEPGFLMALLAGSAEFFGGLALIIGLLVRPAAAVLAFTMFIAGAVVHGSSGLFLSNGGFEFALALFSMTVALVLLGGGKLSLDQWLVTRKL
ncbi:DoxX family protein [Eionea flava]